jgi:putative CocE/NonD family hydrolase
MPRPAWSWLGFGALSVVLAAAPACEKSTSSTSPEPSSGRRLKTSTSRAPRPKSTEVLSAYVEGHYDKREVRIPMRDGATLFTAIYSPKDTSKTYPFLINRTPYSVKPYGEDQKREQLGPSPELMKDGYIFVYQDVRGRFMSDGEFTNMTPHLADKKEKTQVDESSDAYDTIEWLLANVEGHNGRAGMWGISYPGFYAAAGMIDAHPALKAVSPQAPIADWWFDDFHHHGAFFLPHCFNFISSFGRKREGLTKEWGDRFQHGTPDGYQFFYDLGSLANVNERYFKGEIGFWNDLVAHPNYDAYWEARNLLPHLKNTAPAVMTVGGWFDAEDLYGPLQIYREVEANNPDVFNMLVMGPWRHGGWARTDGERLGNVDFGGKQSVFYRQKIERQFFEHFLKDAGDNGLPEAYVFETGANQWREFAAWPPKAAETKSLWLGDGSLSFDRAPKQGKAFDQWVSDPDRPVPFSEDVAIGMTKAYMTDDQRFASRRPDVMVYRSEVLEEDLTLAGPIAAKLWVSTSAGDADFVVKLIDVFPHDTPDNEFVAPGQHMAGYQMMVRSEVMRGRFREGYDKPKPFPRNRPVQVEVPLQDVLHTFQKGHRIMVHVQSTWFPLVDRNPQKWVPNIFEADDDDFQPATHRLYRDKAHPTHLEVGVLTGG